MAPLGARSTKFAVDPAPPFKGQRTGEWERLPDGHIRAYRGRFLDLLAASFSLDGVDDDDLDRHLAAWGLPCLGGPHHSVTPDPAGAELVSAVVERLHQLSRLVDEEARRWSLDLSRLHSPGTAASQLLAGMGVSPPLTLHRPPHPPRKELARWCAALHGGWVDADPAVTGSPFDGVDVDTHSAYPAVASLLGWWTHLTASSVSTKRVTRQLRPFLAGPDLDEAMRDAAVWRHWSLTRVVVEARGEPFPVYLADEDRMVVRPVHGRLDATWLDAVAATLLAGRPPELVEAVQLVPGPPQSGLRPLPVPDGALHPDHDPVLTLYRLRRQAKQTGDTRMTAWLRVLLNSVYGNAARFDPSGDGYRPGPWCWPPLAASITAGCRCLLAMLEVGARRLGGSVPYRDTDGAILAGLDEAQVADLLASFDALDPFQNGQPLWGVEDSGPVVVWAPKRYRFLSETGSRSEHSIGAKVPPAGTTGTDPASGHHDWLDDTTSVLAEGPNADGLIPPFDWEEEAPDWPVMQRTTLSGPDALDELPEALDARPFARVVEATAMRGDVHPVALDPGGDLSGWRDLAWVNARSGEPISVSTDPESAFITGACWWSASGPTPSSGAAPSRGSDWGRPLSTLA